MKVKTIAMFMAVAMLMVGLVSGTLAWLTASSTEVKNEFTTSDISVTLAETKEDFKMIPGYSIDKDPKVTVDATSEACYVFVEITTGNKLEDYIEYTVDSKWTKLTKDKDGKDITKTIYYLKVDGTTYRAGEEYNVLTDNKVTVKDSVTKAMMETAETSKPTLTFKAYASQLYKNAEKQEFTAAEAWANVNPTTTPTT